MIVTLTGDKRPKDNEGGKQEYKDIKWVDIAMGTAASYESKEWAVVRKSSESDQRDFIIL